MKDLWQVGWSWYPSVIAGLAVWTLLYLFASRRGKGIPLANQIAFHMGTLASIIALLSPLDELGDEYLFSAHMVQHLLLMFVAPPLWLVGTPGWLVDVIVPPRLDRLVKRLTATVSGFMIFVGVMFAWHIPFLYQATLESENVHILEHLTFIGAALIGWWAVAGPEASRIPKPAPPLRIVYLFLLAIPCTGLAALLTFAPAPIYTYYVAAPRIFGLDVLQDQRLGGLLMWLPTHLVLLTALGITFLQWFSREGQRVMES